MQSGVEPDECASLALTGGEFPEAESAARSLFLLTPTLPPSRQLLPLSLSGAKHDFPYQHRDSPSLDPHSAIITWP